MRIVVILSTLTAIAGIGMIVLNVAANPLEERRVALAADREAVEGLWTPQSEEPGQPPEALAESIIAEAALWRPIVEPPPPPPKPFDIDAALSGVKPTRRQIGDRIVIDGKGGGDLYGVGDSIGGCRIAEITRKAVVFKKEHNGKTYTKSVPRP